MTAGNSLDYKHLVHRALVHATENGLQNMLRNEVYRSVAQTANAEAIHAKKPEIESYVTQYTQAAHGKKKTWSEYLTRITIILNSFSIPLL